MTEELAASLLLLGIFIVGIGIALILPIPKTPVMDAAKMAAELIKMVARKM